MGSAKHMLMDFIHDNRENIMKEFFLEASDEIKARLFTQMWDYGSEGFDLFDFVEESDEFFEFAQEYAIDSFADRAEMEMEV